MRNSIKSLQAMGTALLRKHGMRADGSSADEERVKEIPYETLPPATLASLRHVRGIGGAVHCVRLGNRPDQTAADSPDNELTIIENALSDE